MCVWVSEAELTHHSGFLCVFKAGSGGNPDPPHPPFNLHHQLLHPVVLLPVKSQWRGVKMWNTCCVSFDLFSAFLSSLPDRAATVATCVSSTDMKGLLLCPLLVDKCTISYGTSDCFVTLRVAWFWCCSIKDVCTCVRACVVVKRKQVGSDPGAGLCVPHWQQQQQHCVGLCRRVA